MKSANIDEEVALSKNAFKVLGGKLTKIHVYNYDVYERAIPIIEKTMLTSDKYPRAYSKIKKTPL